jgi:uncharacterized protein (TIGR02217 family)
MAEIESPRFPDKVAYSVTSPAFRTGLVRTSIGRSYANQYWPEALRTYDLAHPVKLRAELEELHAWFHAIAKGRANIFRFRDPFDNALTVASGVLGAGVGDGAPVYQIGKRHVAGAYSSIVEVKKPVVNTTLCYRNAAPITFGASPGNIALDTTTGLVTFVADATVAITGHTPGAGHQFTTATDPLGLAIGKKVYLTGVTGTAAATLNALAHEITGKSGAGPFTWTIVTNTTALTATTGTALAYPQASDALTAAGSYDIAVRLMRDDFPVRQVGRALWVLDTLPLAEERLA